MPNKTTLVKNYTQMNPLKLISQKVQDRTEDQSHSVWNGKKNNHRIINLNNGDTLFIHLTIY